MERTRERGRVETGEDAPGALPRLKALLTAAREAEGAARTELAGEINRVLSKLRQPGNESEEARLLVAELDAHAFDELLDSSGVSSRKEAVQTLLSLGFPHALQVDPGDLAYTRKEESREKDRKRRVARLSQHDEDTAEPESGFHQKLAHARRNGLYLAGAASVIMLAYMPLLVIAGSTVTALLALVQALLATGSSAYLSIADPPVGQQGLPLFGLGLAALLGVALIPGAGLAALAAAALCCAAVWLVVWKAKDGPHHDPEPSDEQGE